MDAKVREYADALYQRSLSEARNEQQEAITSLKKEMTRRGMHHGFSGIEYGGKMELHAKFIGNDMMARLTSFRDAFEHAGATPTPEDFTEIWNIVREVYERGIQSSARFLGDYAKQRGHSSDPTESLRNAVAHHHDRVLQEWKVWRGRTNVAGQSSPTLPVSAILPLGELPSKTDLLGDLSRLLSTGLHIAVLFIDLDNFKAVNDTIGHDAGDKCLERAAEIIGSAAVHKGRLYRYAQGDEFMVVLPNFREAEARATAERIRNAIDAENPGDTVKVTASIGIVVANQGTHESAEDVLRAADQAMYSVKRLGKNSVIISGTNGPTTVQGIPPREGAAYQPILKYEGITGEGYFAVCGGMYRLQFMNIRNAQLAVETTANNVSACLEFVHAGGDRFFVREALWVRNGPQVVHNVFLNTNTMERLAILGVDRDGELFAVLRDGAKKLQVGKWTIRVSITADNCEPLTGDIGFTVLPEKRFMYDTPAFRPAASHRA